MAAFSSGGSRRVDTRGGSAVSALKLSTATGCQDLCGMLGGVPGAKVVLASMRFSNQPDKPKQPTRSRYAPSTLGYGLMRSCAAS